MKFYTYGLCPSGLLSTQTSGNIPAGTEWRATFTGAAQFTNHVACLTVQNTNYATGQIWLMRVDYAHGTNQSYSVTVPYMQTHTLCVTNAADAFVITGTGLRPDYDTPETRSTNSQEQIGTNPGQSGQTTSGGGGGSPGGSQPPVNPSDVSTNSGVADRQNTDAIIKAIAESKSQAHADATIIDGHIQQANDKLNSILGALLSGTNQNSNPTPPSTNYQGILEGMSNRLSDISGKLTHPTNLSGHLDTNAQASAGRAAASPGLSKLDTLTNGPGGGTVAAGVGPGGQGGLNWTVTANLAGGRTATFVMNPFDHDWVNDLATICRAIITWGSTLAMIWTMSVLFQRAIESSGTWRQAQSAGTTEAGFNVNTVIALMMAGLITWALYELISWGTDWIFSKYGLMGAVIPDPNTSAMAWAIYALQQFIPVTVLVSNLMTLLTFRATLGRMVWLAQSIVRFLVG